MNSGGDRDTKQCLCLKKVQTCTIFKAFYLKLIAWRFSIRGSNIACIVKLAWTFTSRVLETQRHGLASWNRRGSVPLRLPLSAYSPHI